MENNSKQAIAHEIGGVNDALRFGLNGVKSDIVGVHPLQSTFESTKMSQAEMKKRALAMTYGSAFPLKMDLDSRMLARFQRPPGAVSSSMLGLEAVNGSLDDFGFEDFHCLNDPQESETYRPADMHHGMEVRLGLSSGPVCPSFI
ncbi:hypothetical protein MKW94_001790 [Papaver nudicaule]|uniref:Proteasome maturation factor UMP1 n=1 Tax=Papaver nudicaule TaxID=74823 RepID=A0AA41V1Y6_PAPNU|nr:hypothetical protein [Papaver nudicaule]MCL7041427.1 hypothetical protein [Papaver nudicaule]